MESLERREVLTLLGVAADFPTIDYNVDGTVSYDSTTDVFNVDGTPTLYTADGAPFPTFFFPGSDVSVNIEVDETGALVGGVTGDDFVLSGDVDIDGDFIIDFSGVLLTGEILAFGFENTNGGAGATDNYDFRFNITGGLLAGEYTGQDLVMTTESESSTFTGDFSADFGGLAKGQIGGTEADQAPVLGSIGNYVFIDYDENGLQNDGDSGINGITVNLLDAGTGDVIASTVTADDASGNAGFYLFYNLEAGDYVVEFEVPELVTFTAQDAGDDSLDSDADVVTGRSDVITIAAGDQVRDVDAGITPTVTIEKTVVKVEDYVNYCQNKKAGKVKGIDIEYSEDFDELYVSVDFSYYRGRLTDGFTLVLTEGDWVTSAAPDTYAIFYFDADVYNLHGGPVLTVYGYNGKFDAKSFRDVDGRGGLTAADKIATSFDNSDGWLKDISVDTNWHTGTRTMSFRIMASAVNEHIPLLDTEWEGAQIGEHATFALDTYDQLYTKYDSEGYLKKWYYCVHGWMDGCWVETETCIIECEVAIDEFFDEFGWDVSEFPGDSDGDPPTGADDLASDEDWEGSIDFILENGVGFEFEAEEASV